MRRLKVRVRGRSMRPGLAPGATLRSVARRDVARGDLVLLRLPGGGRLVKRVVGLPGERVAADGARVWVDGALLDEPYVGPKAGLEPGRRVEWVLGADEFALLGDARDDSLDSRRLGPFRLEQIEALLEPVRRRRARR